jgi:phosphoribosylaminoimidazolecarboxamide formyltransferase/IMP cyclohydrolase
MQFANIIKHNSKKNHPPLNQKVKLMHQDITKIKRALLSVSNKVGIVEFARSLSELNIELISTGGTSQLLRDANIPVRDVSDLTGFPEIMDGRVKTLHPLVHGGILGLRDEHQAIAAKHNINWIDLVVVNLYPFAETIAKPDCTFDNAIENIDIGGPTMIRSAAKNMGWASVVVDPDDYKLITDELKNTNGLNFETRKALATKAFIHTAEYDALISNYLGASSLNLHLKKVAALRYGENPQQSASAYRFEGAKGILTAKQYQGKELSYNNIADADAAVACAREFSDPVCVIVKHANPCGVAIADTIETAFEKAYQADSVSAFGGIVALNRPCTKELAEKLASHFFEVLVAPSYSEEALQVLSSKVNLRVLELEANQPQMKQELKYVEGGLLIQDRDTGVIKKEDLNFVTQSKPSESQIKVLLFAWHVVKHVKSNAILIAKDNATVGIGAGQVSRIDSVELAIRKSGADLSGMVLASDAFFPFRDSIDRLADAGIKLIIQPGGSVRDEEIIAACNENGIAMVFTNQRCFKH